VSSIADALGGTWVALPGAFVRIVVFFSFIGWAALAPVEATQSRQAQLELHFRAGQQAFQAWQLNQAVEEYKRVLQLDPSVVEARVNLVSPITCSATSTRRSSNWRRLRK